MATIFDMELNEADETSDEQVNNERILDYEFANDDDIIVNNEVEVCLIIE